MSVISARREGPSIHDSADKKAATTAAAAAAHTAGDFFPLALLFFPSTREGEEERERERGTEQVQMDQQQQQHLSCSPAWRQGEGTPPELILQPGIAAVRLQLLHLSHAL